MPLAELKRAGGQRGAGPPSRRRCAAGPLGDRGGEALLSQQGAHPAGPGCRSARCGLRNRRRRGRLGAHRGETTSGAASTICRRRPRHPAALLRKDFIVDPYQVYEARAFGASAVLLIAALLDDRELRELAALARDLGLDVLLEVHDASEMARALKWRAVIGINNRDLRTFEVSLQTSLGLAGLVPPGRLLWPRAGSKIVRMWRSSRRPAWTPCSWGRACFGGARRAAAVSALVEPPLEVARRSDDTVPQEEVR